MVKLTRKYKKKNSISKSMKKHKVSKKSRKSRNKKIIHIKKNSRKQRKIRGSGDGDSDDELNNIESGISQNKSITLVRERKNQIPSVKPSPTARNQSPFVSIFSTLSGSLGDLTKSISSPYPRKTSNISPNITSSSADSEEGGITNTSVPLPKYDLPFSGVEVHTYEYQTYLTNPSIKRYKPMAPLVFESQQKRFSNFLDKSGYTGSEKEDLMNKLTDPDFIHHLDIFIDKMSNTQKSNLNRQEELFKATQKNARDSLRKDILKKIKGENK